MVNNENEEISKLVTGILMEDEKYMLSDWSKKSIFVKPKSQSVPKLVQDAIYNLRRLLIEQKINALMEEKEESESRKDVLETIVNYNNLKQRLFERLNRVI